MIKRILSCGPWYDDDYIYECLSTLGEQGKASVCYLVKVHQAQYDAFSHAIDKNSDLWQSFCQVVDVFQQSTPDNQTLDHLNKTYKSKAMLYKAYEKGNQGLKVKLYPHLFLVIPIATFLWGYSFFSFTPYEAIFAALWGLYIIGAIAYLYFGLKAFHYSSFHSTGLQARLARIKTSKREDGTHNIFQRIWSKAQNFWLLHVNPTSFEGFLMTIAQSPLWPAFFLSGQLQGFYFKKAILRLAHNVFFNPFQYKRGKEKIIARFYLKEGVFVFSLALLCSIGLALFIHFSQINQSVISSTMLVCLIAPSLLICFALIISGSPYSYILARTPRPLLHLILLLISIYLVIGTYAWITLTPDKVLFDINSLQKIILNLWAIKNKDCLFSFSCGTSHLYITSFAFYLVGATIAQSFLSVIWHFIKHKTDTDQNLISKANSQNLRGQTDEALITLFKISNHDVYSRQLIAQLLIEKEDFGQALEWIKLNVYEVGPFRDRMITSDICCVSIFVATLVGQFPMPQIKRFQLYAYMSHQMKNPMILLNSIESLESRFSVDQHSYQSLYHFSSFFRADYKSPLTAVLASLDHSNVNLQHHQRVDLAHENITDHISFMANAGTKIRETLIKFRDKDLLSEPDMKTGAKALLPEIEGIWKLSATCLFKANEMDDIIDQMAGARYLSNAVYKGLNDNHQEHMPLIACFINDYRAMILQAMEQNKGWHDLFPFIDMEQTLLGSEGVPPTHVHL